MLRIDHLIYCVPDLEAAARRFERDAGLASVPGGRHGGWGTANRIVPLGDDYVEIVAAVQPEIARTNAFGRWVLEHAAEGDRLAGWAVATDEIEAVAARVGLDVATGSRTRPDGTLLSWRLVGLERMLAEPSHPLFLQWDVPPELHPGRAAADHRIDVEGIAWIAVGGDERSLERWLGDARLPIRVEPGPAAVRAAGIRTGAVEVVLR